MVGNVAVIWKVRPTPSRQIAREFETQSQELRQSERRAIYADGNTFTITISWPLLTKCSE